MKLLLYIQMQTFLYCTVSKYPTARPINKLIRGILDPKLPWKFQVFWLFYSNVIVFTNGWTNIIEFVHSIRRFILLLVLTSVQRIRNQYRLSPFPIKITDIMTKGYSALFGERALKKYISIMRTICCSQRKNTKML